MNIVMNAGTMREGSKELAKLVNILIVSEIFVTILVGSDASDETALYALKELGPEQVVITLRAGGSIGLNNHGIFRQKTFLISAVDTTGAGDVYHGGYIYGLLKGWKMQECTRFAFATAALKRTEFGAQKGVPNLEDINALLG